ncbi:short-chain dehydrogenase/reductase SDR [Catenulispora acidiphila DSM 44928]|uniref:Short-chain dehydrogenase/reductase SDR n=1 Tax=Catenulispora acidiphila (strain DSM 44928 / JCM 14897 / NBRC 102108 / NRRL B-24433 / ID139908) TaxID=479433 RepID=C7QFX8_CATAD|nr:SDR family oxidoreductase [Catenulispora acidiphila]ACU70955.1 short-chain dehydrogenase/reductase SDR [Catenulispora acidiphila DSM 44928]
MIDLTGKSAIVTGGASGIGRATAAVLAELGAGVVVADLDAERGEEAAKEVGGVFVRCDVSRAADCDAVVEAAVGAYGGVDVLFNNAGIIRRSTVLDIAEDDWDLVMAVNVKSILLMSRRVVPLMAAAGGGSIVNTGSGWGIKGGGSAVSYCASKGAVVNMTRAMAIDHGPQNIRVNCVCPGDTATGMLADEARQLGETVDSFYADAADRPLGRIGQPRDIAQMVAFLASEAAAFVSGAVIPVDGAGTA